MLDFVSLLSACDMWFWSFSGVGDFTVESVRSFIDENTLPSTSFETKWSKLMPIKVNVSAWRLVRDKLLTHQNLHSRGLDVPSLICATCDSLSVNMNHLFSCRLTMDLYVQVLKWWGLDNCMFTSFENWQL